MGGLEVDEEFAVGLRLSGHPRSSCGGCVCRTCVRHSSGWKFSSGLRSVVRFDASVGESFSPDAAYDSALDSVMPMKEIHRHLLTVPGRSVRRDIVWWWRVHSCWCLRFGLGQCEAYD